MLETVGGEEESRSGYPTEQLQNVGPGGSFPRTEEPGELQFMGLQRVRHD